MRKSFASALLLTCALAATAQTEPIRIDLTQKGAVVSPNLYGIFFEEINHAGDGGLYAELVQNRGFEEHVLPSGMTLRDGKAYALDAMNYEHRRNRNWNIPWNVEEKKMRGWRVAGERAAVSGEVVEPKTPLHENTPHAMQLTIKSVQKGGKAVLTNTGYWGMGFKAGEKYDLRCYVKSSNFKGCITARLVDTESGASLGKMEFKDKRLKDWTELTATLTAEGSAAKGALALEFDLMEYEQDMQAQMQTVLTFALTDGSKVTDQMPDELFVRAKDLLDEAGVHNDMLQSYNVQFWSTLVDQGVMMTRSDLSPDYAMDSKLCAHAYDTDLPVYSVESAQEQYDLLNSVPDELAVAMIEDTLDSMDTYNDDLSEMYALWLSGATDELLAFIEADEEPDPAEYPPELITMAEDFNRAMGPDRNEGMSKKALEYLASGKTVFFAVGAAHMLGEEGLVQLLTEAGCTVERYDYAA